METITKTNNITQQIYDLADSFINQLTNDTYLTLRKNALANLLQLSFPTRKNEEYKYVLPDNFFRNKFFSATKGYANVSEIISRYRRYFQDAKFLVLIDGYFSNDWSDIKPERLNNSGVGTVANWSSDFFASLNTCLFPEVVDINITNNTLIILLTICIEAEVLSSPRVFIRCAKNTQATIVEIHEALGAAHQSFCNLFIEGVVEENATLNYYRLQNAGNNYQSLSTVWFQQKENACLNTHTATLSGAWIRNNLTIEQLEQNASSQLNGLLIGSENQITDNHTLVLHSAPHCTSNQIYKAVLKDKSTGVFNGKIYVKSNSQKINAFQSSKNILLSDNATMYTKPQLEIYANDVKCSHGSSTGKLDKQALFYLKARGIGEENAKRLLLTAFVNEVLENIQHPEYKQYLEQLIEEAI